MQSFDEMLSWGKKKFNIKEGEKKKLHQDKREFGKLACNLKDGPYYR